jgi:hypothetical protein
MGSAVKFPGPMLSSLIEWRASRIQDPVARLRFLRRTTRLRPPSQIGMRFHQIGGWRLAASAFLWISLFIPAYTPSRARGPVHAAALPDQGLPVANYAAPQVWPVEKTANFELYSNGLRIENEFAVSGKPRVEYPVFRPRFSPSDASEEPIEWRTEPVGIVFHSTESHQAPFEPSEVRYLKRIGRNLLDYVKSQQSYHFVIDRFGRVFRVVAESDIANHAGKSVWSDAKGTYVGLNVSFLSVAFEAQTDASLPLSAAQIHAARVLTDMLRGKYNIAALNCVTHAQVSVNPSNWRIGYHTDWASGFPFSELGLPDNYAQMVPSMFLFGFEYDDAFVAAAGRPWAGLIATHQLIGERAHADGVSLNGYRQRLQERYRRISAQLRASEDNQDEKYQ